jgi:multiple sugar transport system ATP-binding protein
MADIRIQNLHKRFAEFVAVRDSSLLLEDGKFVVLLGPSGCGKTTTLRMIAGLEFPTSGTIELDTQDVTYLRPRERAEIDRRIKEVASILRIEHLLGSKVGGLAGGDRQRVALGRAIVRQPKAFLMDEPLGTLDAEFRELMCIELRKLHDRLKTTTVFVTHDQNEAMALADQIVVMNQGEILQADDPEGIYNFPSCRFVASFIGRPPMNFLEVNGGVLPGMSAVALDGERVAVPEIQVLADKAVLGVRPEHVRLVGNADGALPGEIKYVEYFGSHWIVDVESTPGTLKVVVDKDLRPSVGDRIGLQFNTERIVLFDGHTERLLPSATTRTHQPGMIHG